MQATLDIELHIGLLVFNSCELIMMKLSQWSWQVLSHLWGIHFQRPKEIYHWFCEKRVSCLCESEVLWPGP